MVYVSRSSKSFTVRKEQLRMTWILRQTMVVLLCLVLLMMMYASWSNRQAIEETNASMAEMFDEMRKAQQEEK